MIKHLLCVRKKLESVDLSVEVSLFLKPETVRVGNQIKRAYFSKLNKCMIGGLFTLRDIKSASEL